SSPSTLPARAGSCGRPPDLVRRSAWHGARSRFGRGLAERAAPARGQRLTGGPPAAWTMDVRGILLWGFAATTILTTVLRGSQAVGLTRLDLPLMLGLIVTPNRDHAKAYGFLIHLMNGWLFTLVYAAFFEYLGRAGWWLGAAIGAVHGVFVLAVGLPAVPGLHPRMATDARG